MDNQTAMPLAQPRTPSAQPKEPVAKRSRALSVCRVILAVIVTMAATLVTPESAAWLFGEEFVYSSPVAMFLAEYTWIIVALNLAASLTVFLAGGNKLATALLVLTLLVPVAYLIAFLVSVGFSFLVSSDSLIVIIAGVGFIVIAGLALLTQLERAPVLSIAGIYALPALSFFAAFAIFAIIAALFFLYALLAATSPKRIG